MIRSPVHESFVAEFDSWHIQPHITIIILVI